MIKRGHHIACRSLHTRISLFFFSVENPLGFYGDKSSANHLFYPSFKTCLSSRMFILILILLMFNMFAETRKNIFPYVVGIFTNLRQGKKWNSLRTIQLDVYIYMYIVFFGRLFETKITHEVYLGFRRNGWEFYWPSSLGTKRFLSNREEEGSSVRRVAADGMTFFNKNFVHFVKQLARCRPLRDIVNFASCTLRRHVRRRNFS